MRYTLWFFAGLYLAVCLLIAVGIVELGLHPTRRPLAEAPCQQAEIISADQLKLRGSFCAAEAGRPGVILTHGVMDNRLGVMDVAHALRREGYTVLAPDSRGHGLSEGGVATYGLRERDDLRRWAKWLKLTQHPGAIFGFGISMGGAQILQTLAPDSLFCAVAVESSFSDLRRMTYTRVGQALGEGPWLGETVFRPGVEAGMLYSRVRYGVDLDEVRPVDVLRRSSTPVLLIHPSADTSVPFDNAQRLYHARPTATELWDPGPFEHVQIYRSKPGTYVSRLLRFYERHLPGCEVETFTSVTAAGRPRPT